MQCQGIERDVMSIYMLCGKCRNRNVIQCNFMTCKAIQYRNLISFTCACVCVRSNMNTCSKIYSERKKILMHRPA